MMVVLTFNVKYSAAPNVKYLTSSNVKCFLPKTCKLVLLRNGIFAKGKYEDIKARR